MRCGKIFASYVRMTYLQGKLGRQNFQNTLYKSRQTYICKNIIELEPISIPIAKLLIRLEHNLLKVVCDEIQNLSYV